jgi:hypothetical protein
MTVLFQPHVHTDNLHGQWIGMKPDEVARAVVDSPLDVIAVTNQIHITTDAFDVRAEIEKLMDHQDQQRSITTLLGVEGVMRENHCNFHVGFIFPDVFKRCSLPASPPRRMTIHDVQEYKESYNALTVMNHPSSGVDRDNNRGEVLRNLLYTGLFDGMEIGYANQLLGNDRHRNRVDVPLEASIFLETRERIRGLAPIGGSDANKPEMLTRIATTVDVDNPRGLFSAIREGKSRISIHADHRESLEELDGQVPGIRNFFTIGEL